MVVTVTQGVRRALWGGVGVLALVVLAVPLSYAEAAAPADGAVRQLVFALACVLVLLLLVPMLALVRSLTSQRLELDDGETLHYVRGRRRIASAPLDACWTDGQRLLVDGHAVLLRGGIPIFDSGPVAELLERVPASQWLPPGGFVRRWAQQMLQRRRATLAALVIMVLSMAALLSVPRTTWRALAKWIAALAGL
jgi:hypothetical protein